MLQPRGRPRKGYEWDHTTGQWKRIHGQPVAFYPQKKQKGLIVIPARPHPILQKDSDDLIETRTKSLDANRLQNGNNDYDEFDPYMKPNSHAEPQILLQTIETI